MDGQCFLHEKISLSIPVGCPAWIRASGKALPARAGRSSSSRTACHSRCLSLMSADGSAPRTAGRRRPGSCRVPSQSRGHERAGQSFQPHECPGACADRLGDGTFVAIWAHEDLGSPDTTGTAGLRHPAPQHPRRIRELRKWRSVGQHPEAGAVGRCPGAAPSRSCPCADPQFAPHGCSLPLGQERCNSPESGRTTMRWKPVGRGDRGCIGRCTRFVPAAMGGEVRRALKTLSHPGQRYSTRTMREQRC